MLVSACAAYWVPGPIVLFMVTELSVDELP